MSVLFPVSAPINEYFCSVFQLRPHYKTACYVLLGNTSKYSSSHPASLFAGHKNSLNTRYQHHVAAKSVNKTN